MTDQEQQQVIDHEHLRLLSLFHYIMGAITIAFSCLFILHMAMMLAMGFGFAAAGSGRGDAAQTFPFFIMALVIGMFICAGITLGIFQILSGRALKRRERRLMSMIVAGPAALMMPFGTILSVMTWIVLSRPGVRTLYGEPGDKTGTT